MENTINSCVLLALLELTQVGQLPNISRLAEYTSIRRGKVAQTLVDLEKLGLCHATKIRLTMKGLVFASSLRAANRAASIGIAA